MAPLYLKIRFRRALGFFRPGWPLLCGGAGAVLVLLAGYANWQYEHQVAISERHTEVAQQLRYGKGSLERILNSRLALAHGLESFVELQPEFTTEEFNRFSANLFRGQKGVLALEIAKGSVLTHVYPLGPNRAALNLDLKTRPDQWSVVERAITTKQHMLAGPVKLVQGGNGAISRLPIFRDGEQFWGLAVVVLDVDYLIDESLTRDTVKGLEVAIRGKDGLGVNGEVFHGSEELFGDPAAIQMDIVLPNGNWQLAGRPEGGWGQEGMTPYEQSSWLGASLLAGLVTWLVAGIPAGQRAAADRARSALARKVSMVENAREAIALVDQDKLCREANVAFVELTGHRPGVEGLKIEEVFPGTVIGASIDQAARGRPATLECEVVSARTHDVRVLEVVLSPRPSRDSLHQVVIVARDITTRRKAEAEMAKVETVRSIGSLAGGIAHDFNNFLGSMLSNVDLVRILLREGRDVSEELEDLRRSTKQAAGLARQLLTFSKGGAPLREVVDLSEFIRDQVRFALAGSRVMAEIDVDPELPPIYVDPSQFAQIIHNLVINAREAMSGGGRLRVGAREVTLGQGSPVPPGRWVRLDITDDGTGIPPELVDKVVEPFFTTKDSGSGIGLAVVRSVIERHGGHLTLRSVEDTGTTFTVWMPPLSEQQKIEPESPSLTVEPTRILVVDDNEELRRLFRRLLTSMGHEVEDVARGSLGVEVLGRAESEGRPFQFAILDLTIPGDLGGVDTLKVLRKIDPELIAIATSGYANNQVMADFRQFGFQAKLEKPFTLEEMVTALATAVATT